MIKFLINPFRRIAGWEALGAGISVLLATAVVGHFSHTHFPDLISVKVSGELPVSFLILQSFSNWLIVSILLYLFSLFLSSSSVRIIDIFGTQALARFPYLLAAFTGFSGSVEKMGKYILWKNLQIGNPVDISTSEMSLAVVLIVLTLLITIWMITLMVNAYKISANLKGTKLVVSFIISAIASVILSGLISNYFIHRI